MKKGWEEKMLKEIGLVQTGTTPKTTDKKNYGDFIPFIKPADIDIAGNGEIRYDNDGLSEQGLRTGRKMTAGSILMVCIGATIGKVGYTDRDVSCNQQINTLTLGNEFYPKFFYYALTTSLFFEKVIHNSAQATLPIINKSKWESLTVRYPKSLSEQQHIVSILDEAFAAIAKAKANTERNLQNAKKLFESYLQSVFANPGEDWREMSIEETTKVINGFAFKSTDFSEKNHLKSIKITNVGVKTFVEENDNLLPKKFKETHKEYLIHEGDIVIALTRTIIADGLKVSIVPASYEESLINQRVAALISRPELIKTKFLYSYLCSKSVEKYVISHVNTLMQPNLSIVDLKQMPVPVPSVQEQEKIIRKLDALSTETKKLEAIYQQKLNDLEELKKSILQKAFSGELKTEKELAI